MSSTQHTRPIWLIAIVTPWVATLLFALWCSYGPLPTKSILLPVDRYPFGMAFVMASFFVLPASYIATFIFGLPWVVWLRNHGRLTWLYVCSGSVVIGVITATLYGALISEDTCKLLLTTLGIVFGLICGVSSCLAAGIHICQSTSTSAAQLGQPKPCENANS